MSTPRRINSAWHEWIGLTIVSTLLLAVGLGIVACGTDSAALPTATETPAPIETPAPQPPTCDATALAAVDLSGQCRAVPQATMGALEAVSS